MADYELASDTTDNICDYCDQYSCFPECWPDIEEDEFSFGDGLGNDNIIGCINYTGGYFTDNIEVE